jgi:excisionase family DNA binding protein
VAEWEYLKIKELAALLQLNQQTVRNWVNASELEYVKIGRAKHIPRRAAVRLAGRTGWGPQDTSGSARQADAPPRTGTTVSATAGPRLHNVAKGIVPCEKCG